MGASSKGRFLGFGQLLFNDYVAEFWEHLGIWIADGSSMLLSPVQAPWINLIEGLEPGCFFVSL